MDRFLFQAEKRWSHTTSCTTNNVELLDIFQSIVNKWKRMGEKKCQWFAVYPILWAKGNGLATDALRPFGQSTELGKKGSIHHPWTTCSITFWSKWNFTPFHHHFLLDYTSWLFCYPLPPWINSVQHPYRPNNFL